MCGGVIGNCLNSISVFSGPTDTAVVESMISSSVFCDLYLQRVRLRNSLHSYHFCFVLLVLTIPVLMSLLTTISVSKHNIS